MFKDFLGRMFPQAEQIVRQVRSKDKTAPKRTQKSIRRTGRLHWWGPASPGGAVEERSAPVEVWEPTRSRKGEVRLAKVHRYGLEAALPKAVPGVRVLLLLIQQSDGRVWPRFVTETTVKKGDWELEVQEFLLRCLNAKRRKGVAASGYLDLDSDASHPPAEAANV